MKLLKLIKLKFSDLTIKTEDAANWQYKAGCLYAIQISALSKFSFPFYEKPNPCISLFFSGASGAKTTANSVEINIKIKSGIIHEIDTVLLSAKPPIETPGDLIEVATKLNKFTRILKAIADLNMTETFKTVEATVFAPSDDVFAELEKENPKIIENLTDEQKLALISR